MTGGANKVTIGFTSPVCDELRITATTTASTAIDRIHFAGLSISSGLVFDSSSGLSSEAQPTITRLSPTNHYTFRVTTETATTHTVTITGIAQAKLDIRQMFFAELDWRPTINYANESDQGDELIYLDQSAGGSHYQTKTGGGRSQALGLIDETEANILDLLHLEKNQTVAGLCLFERDADSTTLRQDYAYAVNIRTAGVTPTAIDKYRAVLNIKEAFEQ
jgi:hypothetical protein